MKTNVEKNVAAFDQVLGHCNALGKMYNPSKESLKVAAMTSLLTSAQVSLKAVDTAKSNLILAINARQRVFSTLPGFGTRILNALKASDASPQLIADIRLYRDKFRAPRRSGQTVPAKPEDSSKAQPNPGDSSRGPLSQLDYDTKIRNFGTMIEMLKGESAYKPNEAELTIAGLTTMLTSLRQTHKAVADAELAISNARLVRNKLVYGDNGIYGTIKRVKTYVLSVFGATSVEFRMFNRIRLMPR